VLQRAAACCSARARARDAATARPFVRARAFRRPGVLGVLTGRRRRPAPPRRLNAARDGAAVASPAAVQRDGCSRPRRAHSTAGVS
jgi:hypothetical protein